MKHRRAPSPSPSPNGRGGERPVYLYLSRENRIPVVWVAKRSEGGGASKPHAVATIAGRPFHSAVCGLVGPFEPLGPLGAPELGNACLVCAESVVRRKVRAS